jgi:YVTN family beta-propeller protein
MNNTKLIPMLLMMIMAGFSACKKDNPPDPVPPAGSLSGIFIVNEGAFGSSNGSISFLNRTSGQLTEDLFMQVNSRPLGDVVQSMHVFNGRGYIVVNNSQKIEVVDMKDFKSVGVITGITSPRYFMPVNDSKAYVTDWSTNSVAVVDLAVLAVVKWVTTGNGPEQMVLHNGKAYIANSGGFGLDSTVTVIDVATDNVANTHIVGVNPNSMVVDANNLIWVLCGGSTGPDFIPGTADDIGGELSRIRPQTNSVDARFLFTQFDHPFKMTSGFGASVLYFLSGLSGYTGAVFSMDVSSIGVPTVPLVSQEFYGLGIDPVNGQILGASVPGFSQKGYMVRHSSGGAKIDSVLVGIAPNGFSFH